MESARFLIKDIMRPFSKIRTAQFVEALERRVHLSASPFNTKSVQGAWISTAAPSPSKYVIAGATLANKAFLLSKVDTRAELDIYEVDTAGASSQFMMRTALSQEAHGLMNHLVADVTDVSGHITTVAVDDQTS